MKIRSILILLVLVIVGAGLWWRLGPKRPPARGAAAGPGAGPRTVAVLAVDVAERDIPIWLIGLGSVQAFNSVTIRPRVSGTLDQVNFVEGQMVKAGDVLARIDPRPYQSALEQARAQKAQNDAQLANSRQELTRVRALVESEAEGKRLLEQQESAVAQYSAQVQGNDAAIRAAQLELDFTTLRAPIAGRTGVRMIDAGNLVTENQSTGLVVIAQLQPISVVFNLPQQYLPAIRRRMTADPSPLTVQAMGENGTVLTEGKLELVDNQVDPSTGTVKLKATFTNEGFPLWPGQFLTARLLVEVRTRAVTVPSEVVQAGLNGPFAYVIKPDKTVEARNLTVGPTVEGITVIEKGLKPGEKVVRDGQSKLQPGAKITIGERAT